MMEKILVLMVASLCCTAQADELNAFASDGCSDFPDGNLAHKTLWRNCCISHDLAYWLGGTYAERQAADEALQSCVAETGEPEIAVLMLAGVRVGGSPYWPTRYRWGYGWPYWDGFAPRGYKVLSDTEKQQAEILKPIAPGQYN